MIKLVRKLFWPVGKYKKRTRREILYKDSQIQSPKSGNNFIVPLNLDADWSSPDDPARVLAAIGINKEETSSHYINIEETSSHYINIEETSSHYINIDYSELYS